MIRVLLFQVKHVIFHVLLVGRTYRSVTKHALAEHPLNFFVVNCPITLNRQTSKRRTDSPSEEYAVVVGSPIGVLPAIQPNVVDVARFQTSFVLLLIQLDGFHVFLFLGFDTNTISIFLCCIFRFVFLRIRIWYQIWSPVSRTWPGIKRKCRFCFSDIRWIKNVPEP